MKKIILTIALSVFTISGFSQRFDLYNYFNTTKAGNGNLMQKVGSKETDNATGSPYIVKTFMLGNINGVQESILVKYNAYTDEIELDNGDGKVFILPKDPEFNTISLKTGTIYRLVEYSDENDKNVNGYLIEKATTKGITLLMREKTFLIPEKQPQNGYGSYVPPKFERASDEYYLELKNKRIVSFPKNKKKLQQLFPEHKSTIDSYLKTNDLSFKKENDMVKIAEFVSTLS